MPVDATSSSSSNTLAPVTANVNGVDEADETLLRAIPLMVRVSSASSTWSSSGVSVNVALPLNPRFGIVIAKSGTGSKSTASALPLPDTDTATSVGS